MSDIRFDRLEQSLTDLVSKVDSLSKLVTAVVRMEEKNLATQQRLDTIDVRINKHSAELDAQLVTMSEVKNRGLFNEWFIRGLIATMIGGVFFLLKGGA